MRIGLFLTIFSVATCLCPQIRASGSPACASNEARVVVVENPRATQAFQAQASPVREMVRRGIIRFTGTTNEASAWRTLVSTQDTVGIKVFSAPGMSGTRPAVAAAVIEGLLAAGVPRGKIILWDKRLEDLRLAGYDRLAQQYKIRLAGSAEAGYDEQVEGYDSPLLGNLVWGDVEFGRKGDKVGRRSFLSKLLTKQITKIINISPLLNHNLAGVNGNLCSLALGSVDNTQRFEATPERLATAVPEIYALPQLCDRVTLNITDALIAQYRGEQLSLLHYSSALNQLWFSKDPVALDVLSVQELDRDRQAAGLPPAKGNLELFQNAALLKLGTNDFTRICIDLLK